MRRDWKKVLSLVLAASMALTMNTVAFAGTASDNTTAIETEVSEAATEVTEVADEAVEAATEAAEVSAVQATDSSTIASSNTISNNAFKFMRKYAKYTVSGTKVKWENVEYNFGKDYVPGKATLSACAIDGVTDGSKQLYLFYEYYDSNPWYDSRVRAWDGSYYNFSKSKYTKVSNGNGSTSKSVSVDAALVWYDQTAKTYTKVDGVRVGKVTFKNAKNATKDLSGNELTTMPKYKDSFIRLTLNINKNKADLSKDQIKTVKKFLKNNEDSKLDFGIARRSLSANQLQGSQGIYSSLKIKASSFTIKNLQMRIRFMNADSGENGESSNSYQDKVINIKLPKKTGSTGKTMAEKKVVYGAYCVEFSKKDGTVVLKGVNNFDGEVVLITNSPYGTFTVEQ